MKASSQLLQYKKRYKKRLTEKNLNYISKILLIMRKMLLYLKSDVDNEYIVDLNNILFEMDIDNINLFKIEKFFEKSEIVKKVKLFVQLILAKWIYSRYKRRYR